MKISLIQKRKERVRSILLVIICLVYGLFTLIDIQDTMSKKADLTKRNTFLNKESYFIQIYFYNVKIH
jgi:hypothetical protein